MTGHDPDDTGDDPADARDDPNEPGDGPSDAGDAPTDAGDDTDGAHRTDEERPGDWPDDWTTADDVTHSPTADSNDDTDDRSSTVGGDDADDTERVDDVDATADSNDSDHADDRAVDAENAAALASDSDDTDPAPEASEPNPESTDPVPDSASATAESNEEDESTASDADDSTASDADESTTGDVESSTLGERPDPRKPPAPGVDDGPTIEDDGVLTWFRNTNNGFVVVVRDVVSSVAAVAAIGLVLFAISGIWPPLVAVESGSMEPHMSKGDLVFLVDENRYAPQSAIDDTGVSTYRSASAANGYSKFGEPGDVIVYEPFGDERTTPIIHRARFHVEKGERWVQDANPEYLGSVDSCAEVPRDMCPAPYDGFITKGDANSRYDQVGDQSSIVKDDWIRGKAEVRIPLLGWIRLQFAKLAVAGPGGFGSLGAITARVGALGVAAGATVVSIRL